MHFITDRLELLAIRERILAFRCLAEFCRGSEAVSSLFVGQDSCNSVFVGIHEDPKLVNAALAFAQIVAQAVSDPLLLLQRTQLKLAIREHCLMMEMPAIECACQVLVAVLQKRKTSAAAYLMVSGVVHVLFENAGKFSFRALQSLVRALCHVC
jgi:hypothetical protein